MRFPTSCARCAVVVFSLLISLTAEAQSQRAFVTSVGLDTNACSLVAPCRSFGAALAAVVDGGEVIVLDSAGYGPVTIAKSVSIISPAGVYAGVTATSGDGITINPGPVTVVLRGLTIRGVGSDNGINFASYGTLHVENCEVSRFANGLQFQPMHSSQVFVDDSVFRENTTGLFFYVFPTSENNAGSIDRSRVEANTNYGVVVQQASGMSSMKVTMRDTLVAGNASHGLYAYFAKLNVKDCVVVNNGEYGIYANFNAVVTVSGSMIAENAIGLVNDGSTFNSFGNNELSGNGTAWSGTITTASWK